MADVVCAFFVKDKSFFACQRPKGKKREFLWEFPGGKVEKGETNEQALKREIKEELGITVTVKQLLHTEVYEYPDLPITLYMYKCETNEEPKMLEHNAFAWIKKEEIDNYEFCPADSNILRHIKGGMFL